LSLQKFAKDYHNYFKQSKKTREILEISRGFYKTKRKMKTLKINIPHGFKIKSFDEKTGEVNFEPVPKDIKERIKNFDDVLKYHGYERDEKTFERDLTERGFLEDEIAYCKLKLITKALNEGWTPDWSNVKEYKYYPWFNMNPSGGGFSYDCYGGGYTGSAVGSRLCFKSCELAEYAAKQFRDVYEKVYVI